MNAPLLHAPDSQEVNSTSRDFLKVLRRSGVLSARQIEQVRARVSSGRYPDSPTGLARKLVKAGILTQYQARHLLHSEKADLVVGRYVILDRLGSGSMGRVYRARHRLMGREVALKVIDPDLTARRGALARFRREMQLIGRLDHPNIVRAFDADQVGDVPYIVMECLPGRSLDQVFEAEGPLSPAVLAPLAAQAALGLAHAHDRGVVHRDIKPSNLIVTDSGVLKVLDFGVGALTGLRADDMDALTADGLAVGTVEYMSPEQARGLAVDGRSDLYSLGCVLYHLLTGRIPFPSANKFVSLALRVEGRPVPIADHRPDLPPAVVEVIERLMAARPEDRYATASEAAEALQAVSRGLDPAPKVESPGEAPPSPRANRLAALIQRHPGPCAAAAAAMAAATFGLGAIVTLLAR